MNKGTVRVLERAEPVHATADLGRDRDSAASSKCSKNSAFQALDTLLKEGYLVRSSSGPRYQLAHQVLNFGLAAESTDVRSLCHPYLQRIHELTSESVFLAILVGRVVRLHRQHPGARRDRRATRRSASPCRCTPAPVRVCCSPISRTKRSSATSSSNRRCAPSHRRRSPIRRPCGRRSRLIRKSGFARGYQDFSTGANFLAFPVIGPDGTTARHDRRRRPAVPVHPRSGRRIRSRRFRR